MRVAPFVPFGEVLWIQRSGPEVPCFRAVVEHEVDAEHGCCAVGAGLPRDLARADLAGVNARAQRAQHLSVEAREWHFLLIVARWARSRREREVGPWCGDGPISILLPLVGPSPESQGHYPRCQPDVDLPKPSRRFPIQGKPK